MKEEWRKYDPTGKLFPKEEGQSIVPILIEFPYDLYPRSRNSYYKKLRTAIKILGLITLLILLTWMSVIVYINYAPKLTSAADTPSDTSQNIYSKPQSSIGDYDSYTTYDSYTEDQTVTSIPMAMKKLDGQKSVPELLSEEQSINKPDTVENKLWELLEEVWKKLKEDAENKSDKNMTKQSADDIKSENKYTAEFTKIQENIKPSIETSVTNASLESKSERIYEYRSSEENYSEYIDEDSDESGIEDQTVTTLLMPSSEAAVNVESIEEAAKVKDDISINKPEMVENKFMNRLGVWKKLQNDAKNQNDKTITKTSVDYDIKSENSDTSDESDTEDQVVTTLPMSSMVTEVNFSSVTESAKAKENIATNEPDVVGNKFMAQSEKTSNKLLNDTKNKEDYNNMDQISSALQKSSAESNKNPVLEDSSIGDTAQTTFKFQNDQKFHRDTLAYNDPGDNIELENEPANKSTIEDENPDEKITKSLVTNASSKNKSVEADKDESSEELHSDYYDEVTIVFATANQTEISMQTSTTESAVNVDNTAYFRNFLKTYFAQDLDESYMNRESN